MLKKEVCRFGNARHNKRVPSYSKSSISIQRLPMDIPFHQDNVEINLVLTLSRDFLRFEVPLMAEEKVSSELLNQLFEMNYRIAMAKFAMADDGMVRLVCDFPTVNMSFEEFQVSMQIVVSAAFDFIPQIRAIKAKPIGFEIPRIPKPNNVAKA